MKPYSQTRFEQLLKKKIKKKFFKIGNSLMQVKVLQNAPLEHSAILLTCIKLPPVFLKRPSIFLFLYGSLRQVWLYVDAKISPFLQ